MRQTYNVNFYCRDAKVKDGVAPVELVVTINGDRKTMVLPKKFTPADFKRLRSAARKNPVNTYLTEVTSDIDWIHDQFPAYSPAKILEAYSQGVRPGAKYVMTVRELAFKYLANVIGHRPSFCRYQATYKKFCQRYGNWLAEDIRGAEIKAYIEDLRSKGYQDSTLQNEHKRLKGLFQYGSEMRVIEHHPFAELQIRYADPKAQVFLTLDEVEKIAELKDLPPYLERVQMSILFLMGSGLEWADLKNLKKEDVQSREDGMLYIRKNRIKTQVQYLAILVGHAPEIWKRCNGAVPCISNQKMNEYARQLAEKAGVTKHLTTLVCRRTYATLLLSGAYGKMIPVEVVQRTLGHARPQQTMTYAKMLDESVFNAFK